MKTNLLSIQEQWINLLNQAVNVLKTPNFIQIRTAANEVYRNYGYSIIRIN